MCVGTGIAGSAARNFHRFNAARSIVCVGTSHTCMTIPYFVVSMPHAALCVSGPLRLLVSEPLSSFNAARSIVCVGTLKLIRHRLNLDSFNAARSIVCVGTMHRYSAEASLRRFNAARSIVCVGTRNCD